MCLLTSAFIKKRSRDATDADDTDGANTIAQGLRNHRMAVDVAYDGRDAVTKLNLHSYDVVLLGRDLPGIHGDQLCQIITQSENPAMILMLTAAGSPDDRVPGLALGADDYLPKPFYFPELVGSLVDLFWFISCPENPRV